MSDERVYEPAERSTVHVTSSRVEAPGTANYSIAGHRFSSLDGLRAVAIILVFLYHLRGWIPGSGATLEIAKFYLSLGWMGVDLFFVLSGFLITGILLDTRETTNYFSGFYARRFLRIFPLAYLVLAVVMLGSAMLVNAHIPGAERFAANLPAPQDRWLYVAYLMNWTRLWHGPVGVSNCLVHYWSLAVEEQFYLVWPVMVWMLSARNVRRAAVALAIGAAGLRLVWTLNGGSLIEINYATVTRMDALFVGAFCATVYRDVALRARVQKWLPGIAALGVGGYVLAASALLIAPERCFAMLYPGAVAPHALDDAASRIAQLGGYTLLAIGFGAIVLRCASADAERSWTQRILRSGFFRTIGTYSYGIYVYHLPVMGALAIFLYPRIAQGANAAVMPYVLMVLACVATFLISAFSYELFESRILRYKRFFEPKI